MARVLADDTENALALDYTTVTAESFNGWFHFHGKNGIISEWVELVTAPVITRPSAPQNDLSPVFWREDGICNT